MKYKLSLFVVLLTVLATLSAYCQVDRGGVPRSFQSLVMQKSQLQLIEVAAPDIFSIQNEDNEDAGLEKAYRVGVEVPVAISSASVGQWDELAGGGRIWRVTLTCKGAQAIGLNYNELRFPEGADIFVYTPDHNFVIGAIGSNEVPVGNKFATRPLPGYEIVIEYYEPANSVTHAVIEITGIAYIYRSFELRGFEQNKSATGNCEINVNCEEGQNWQNQKDGVVKILTKVGSKYFYCTGSVMNNTSQDFSGLLLTASHCSKDFGGGFATVDDFSLWVFYFKYESPGCSTSGAPELTVVGAQELAISSTPTEIGSDFLLLKFLGNIPANYNPYYCGWDVGNGNSSSGVCIHHPNGEVKKISTYTSALGSGTWGSIPETHWTLHWAPTINGHGVTEGGSSGAPLFDNEGRLIGTLTGGLSACDNTNGEDMFGKMSFSWESNGTSADQQLKPWLDPGNTGIKKMPGSFNENLAIADFSANTNVTPVGGTIDFQDMSSGKPDKWHWYFQSGKPSESNEQNPAGIRFDRFGFMNVKLVVSNAYNADSIVKFEYIDVRSVVSPNPTSTGTVSILTDVNNAALLNIDVFDVQGKIAGHFEFPGASESNYSITLPKAGNLFVIRVMQGDQVQTHRVVVIR